MLGRGADGVPAAAARHVARVLALPVIAGRRPGAVGVRQALVGRLQGRVTV